MSLLQAVSSAQEEALDQLKLRPAVMGWRREG